MNTKLIASIVAIALIASSGVALAHNVGDAGTAYPGVPCITPIAGGDCVNVYSASHILEAATIGSEGYQNDTAYAGRPFFSPRMY